MLVDAAGTDAFTRMGDEQRPDLGRRDLGHRHVAERSHDAADRHAAAAAVRRPGHGEHRAVVAKRRRLGSEDELDVREPRVREARNVGPPAAASRAASSLSRARAAARSASTSSTNSTTRRRAWYSVMCPGAGRPLRGRQPHRPSRTSHACAPSRRRTRWPSALRHLTAHTGWPEPLVVSTRRKAVESGS